jgi:hypothetical protein
MGLDHHQSSPLFDRSIIRERRGPISRLDDVNVEKMLVALSASQQWDAAQRRQERSLGFSN